MPFTIRDEKPFGREVATLFDIVNWGVNDPDTIEASIAAYPCTLTARDNEGHLIGYLSAFSDEVMTTVIGELVVHPDYQRSGIGSALLRRLRERYPKAATYATALPIATKFFQANGFRVPSIGMSTMVCKGLEAIQS